LALPTSKRRRASLVGFVLAAALFVVAGGVAVSHLVDLRAANTAVEHTLLVRAETEALLSLLKDAETGERGYIITGQQEYIAPYNEALTELPKRINNFRRLTADNAKEQSYIAMFDNLASRKMAILQRAIAARQTHGFDAAAALISTGEGQRVMNAARDVVAQMLMEEDRLWQERGLEQRDQATRTAAMSISALAIALVLLVIATVTVSLPRSQV
jgi:CHASE3 domain sensor protein